MRLKAHREDVKFIQKDWQTTKLGETFPKFEAIARRYLNLIRAMEEALPTLQYTNRRYKVVKDSEEK